MRLALTALALTACAFVAGSAAAAIGYGSEDGCLAAADFREGSESVPAGPEHRWWPLGSECVTVDGTIVPADERPSVAGSLGAVVLALVALSVAWWRRERGWARGLAVGIGALAFTGALTGFGGVPAAWFVGAWLGPVVGACVDAVLTSPLDRSFGRSALVGLVGGVGALFVAVFFVLLGWAAVGLVLALPVAAAAGWLCEWVLRDPVRGAACGPVG